MRILTLGTLRDFWERHSDAEAALDGWYRETLRARWNTPAEVIARYPDASIVGSDRVVFRIRGNAYRLVAGSIFVSSAPTPNMTASTPRRCNYGSPTANYPYRGGVPAGSVPD